jgi:hypothetical protein
MVRSFAFGTERALDDGGELLYRAYSLVRLRDRSPKILLDATPDEVHLQ